MRFLSAFLAFFVSAYVIRGEPINVSYALSQDSVILDVRTPDEYLSGHIKGAINIDFYASDFQNQLGKLDKEKDYKVYCRSGNRSSKAVNMMKNIGFKNVENIGSVSQASKNLNLSCDKGPC
ncbi:MAG: rhodanese-like domain-containing protein [Bdellovibrionaceae bacterium]|nr:rhodanese-like domain-containing protein [Pseudobdellovibrionaceae bacterium]